MPVLLSAALTAWERLAAVLLGGVLVLAGETLGPRELATAGTAVLFWAVPWPSDLRRMREQQRRIKRAGEAVADAPEPVRRRVRESLQGTDDTADRTAG